MRSGKAAIGWIIRLRDVELSVGDYKPGSRRGEGTREERKVRTISRSSVLRKGERQGHE